MNSEKKKEEIIELTEVVEEGPAIAAKNDPPERLASNSEGKKDPLHPQASEKSFSALTDISPGIMKEAPARQAESWALQEGTRLVERLAADVIPRIVAEKLSSQLEKLKAETDNLRARAEAFPGKFEAWFSSEGLKFLEQKAREAIPRVAAEALHPEIENLKKEIEKVRTQAEEMSRRTQSWLETDGKQILETVARQIFPQIAERILRQEIERLRQENRTPGKE